MEIKLNIGDIVIDIATGDVGLLVNRYCLFDPPEAYYTEYEMNTYEYAEVNLWAWDIFWTGPNEIESIGTRYQPYTESGLVNLIKTVTFLLKTSYNK